MAEQQKTTPELKPNEFVCIRCGGVHERPARIVKCFGHGKRQTLCSTCLPLFVGCDDRCREAQRDALKEIQNRKIDKEWKGSRYKDR